MVENIRWWLSFQRNPNFWDWVKENYSTEELEQLSNEVLETSLINKYDLLADQYFVNGIPSKILLKETTHRLYKHYESEIWSACFGAGNYDPANGLTGLECLSKLKFSSQVYEQNTFEEFLVRNALKYVPDKLLSEINSVNKKQILCTYPVTTRIKTAGQAGQSRL